MAMGFKVVPYSVKPTGKEYDGGINEKEGILSNTDVLIKNAKMLPKKSDASAKIIDEN